MNRDVARAVQALRTYDHPDAPDWADKAEDELKIMENIPEMIDALKAAYVALDEAIEYLPGGRQRVEAINSRNMVMNALVKVDPDAKTSISI